jgi:hypothetical protein
VLIHGVKDPGATRGLPCIRRLSGIQSLKGFMAGIHPLLNADYITGRGMRYKWPLRVTETTALDIDRYRDRRQT